MDRNTIINEVQKYSNSKKNILLHDKFYEDLKIYGDDIEEIVYVLSEKFQFKAEDFWKKFIHDGFDSPPEISLPIPQIFYLNLSEIFKGNIKYNKPRLQGKDITVENLIQIVEKLKKGSE